MTDCCLTIDPPGLCVFLQLYVSGWGDRGEGRALGSEAGGAESDSQAKGENLAYLFWNFIIFNYLDQDDSPSLLPSLLLLSTLSRKHNVSSHSLVSLAVRLSAAWLLSRTCVASPLRITPIGIFNLLLPALPSVWLILFKKCSL